LNEDNTVSEAKTGEASHQTPGIPPDRAVAYLQGQLTKGRDLLASRAFNRGAYDTWSMATKRFIEKIFGPESPQVQTWVYVPFLQRNLAEGLQSLIEMLEGYIEVLRVDAEFSDSPSVSVSRPVSPAVSGDHIFIVHGHDEGSLQRVARFLETLKQNVIVLKERPGKGRTVIEKFEDYAKEVGFVVALLTSDDRGGPREAKYSDQQSRARQNVVFELGYFIGRLGRSRVCALRAPDVEIPSDYSGVQYVTLDTGSAWQLELAKEMKAAGLNVDMNLVVS
jgi:predicted nucleotide-binding protein